MLINGWSAVEFCERVKHRRPFSGRRRKARRAVSPPSVRRTFLVAFGYTRQPGTSVSYPSPGPVHAIRVTLRPQCCHYSDFFAIFSPFPYCGFCCCWYIILFFSFRLLLSNSRLAFILKMGSHSHQSLHWIECVPQWCVQMMVARYIRSLNIHCDFSWLTIREFPRSFFNFFFFFSYRMVVGRIWYMSHILGWWSESLYVYFP